MNNLIKKGRLAALTGVFLLLLAVFVIELYKLQIVEGKRYYEETKNNVVTTETVLAARGNILDRYGRLLVTNTSSYDIMINTGELFPSDESVDSNEVILQLVKMVRDYGNDYTDWLPITQEPPFEYKDISAADEARLNAYKEARKLSPNASAVEVLSDMRNRYEIDGKYSAEEARIIAAVRYAINVRYLINTSDYIFVENADMKLIAQLKENNMVGVSVKESFVREYQTEYAAHILGYVNWMSEAQYEAYKEEEGYNGNTKIGQDGAERAFEKYLHGSDGVVQYTSAADGTIVKTEYTTEPKPGSNVYLTIDIQLQEAAERALKSGIESIAYQMETTSDKVVYVDGEWVDKNSEVTGGAVVVVDVKTGEPLAIASYPTYDLTSLLENYNQILAEKNNPLYNRALQGEYAPGSTFKPCTSIAGLTEGFINTETRLECGGIYTKYEEYGYAPRCWIYGSGVHGPDCLCEALRDSCNCFFYEVGRQLGIDRMDKYAALLGLGESTGIELPENTGNMSNSATHFNWVGEDWTIGDTLQAAIGQSDSMFTPLQLAEYCAAVANNGERHSASILKYVRSYDYSEKEYERDGEVISKVESEQYNWDAIHQGMWMVANEWAGSGYHVFEGYTASTVACKTGTAQKGLTVSNDGIFICYAPFEDPEIAIAVVVERGGAGANCGGIAREILETYFGIKTATDITETEGTLLR